ncbi:MAG: FlgD immunoglobulin-like domain containing protein [Chthoniobacterales bacterium]
MRIAILSFVLSLAVAVAQETPTPSSTPSPSPAPPLAPERSVLLRFALPPLEGTISLGIYDQTGKLVRVLHREDALSEFTKGNDALETTWDGNDDDGKPLPNGKYSARGYVVGDLKIEGVDYFFNDWVTDESSPHIRRLTQLWMEQGSLRIDAELAGGKKTAFVCDPSTGAIQNEVAPMTGVHCNQIGMLPNVIDCARGMDGTTWLIDSAEGRGPRTVKQFSKSHDVLRQLDYVTDDPQPERIEASPARETIFLLERNKLLEQFRGLALVQRTTNATDGAVSTWKKLFDKKIVAHEGFTLKDNRPVAASATTQSEPGEVTQKLLPNPLQHDKPGSVALAIGLDADGSFLETTDGLPLRTISDTPNLRRALPARPNDDALDVFQDDGAVVEQFHLSNLTQMMAFDCGDFELK